MKIVVIDSMYFAPQHIQELMSLGDFVSYPINPKNEKEALERVKDADIIVNFWYTMPAHFFEVLPKLKMICVAAVGYEWIDVDTAKKYGVTITNCPRHNGEAVAEHTIGLILSAARQVSRADFELRKGNWNSEQYKGKELKGRTLGIIGYGFIGQRVGEIAQKGFGMNLRFINSRSSRKDLEDLLRQSDIISINAPLNRQTKNFLTAKEFDLMKPGVVIVNTGRGAIVDEQALINNLKSGKIYAAGWDTFIQEPLSKTNPLFTCPNIIVTPHIGWNTEESEMRLSQMIVDNIKHYLKGAPQNVVL